jgi:hypothetical protein
MMNLDHLLAELIEDAALRYGPRYRADWPVEPVLVEGTNYPETIVDQTRQSIRVRVTEFVWSSAEEARYELAHEAIHCLLASGARNTVFFEEGLTVRHGLTLSSIPRRWRDAAERKLPSVLSEPYEAFQRLKPTDKKIRALRADCPDVEQLANQPELVMKHFKVHRAFAEKVCRRMEEARPEKM